MAKASARRGSTESIVSWGIMAVLALIVLGVALKQAHFDRSVFEVSVQESGAPVASRVEKDVASVEASTGEATPLVETSSGAGLTLGGFAPPGTRPFSAQESFGSDTLSDKINGKAELYLSAGFRSLLCQRFQLEEDPHVWMEIFVYDMGALRQAYSVFSAQRRSEAELLPLAPYAYRTQNALYLVHGRHYIEAVASAPSDAMMNGALAFAKSFMEKVEAEKEVIGEMALFPVEGLEAGSITLLSKDVFSYEKLENVYTAHYSIDGSELTAFLTRKESSEEAAALAAAYRAFLLQMGGKEEPTGIGASGAVLINIMDAFELLFTHGPFLAGIHEAENRQAAEKLASMLAERLKEAPK